MMRTLRESPSARSSARLATLLTLVPAWHETSYVVTVGPGWISSTLADHVVVGERLFEAPRVLVDALAVDLDDRRRRRVAEARSTGS